MTSAADRMDLSLELEPFDVLAPVEIEALLAKLSQAQVAVVGDFCLDAYWTINPATAEISVETGRETRPVAQQRYAPGGAGNVVMNLAALGVARILPVGVLGRDVFGSELSRLLDHPQIIRDNLLIQVDNWQTQTYIKPCLGQTEMERIDFGNFNVLEERTANCLLERLEAIAKSVSVMVVNHQTAGSMHNCEIFRRGVARLMEKYAEVCFIVDSRGYHTAYPKAVHKMNEAEVMKASGKPLAAGESVSLRDLLRQSRLLSRQWKSPLIVTRGDKGCFIVDGEICQQIFGVQLLGNVDPVGAGDTFVSALAGTVATGSNLAASAFIANLAAAVTTQKLFQTGTASPSEILEMGSGADFAYRPELAFSPAEARLLPETEIEIITELPTGRDLRHAIFDHDGTISTLCEGWEQIMEPMMVHAILGAQATRDDEALTRRAEARVKDFINVTTGMQTIDQMHALREIVLEFGCVSEKEVLEPAEYKSVYRAELRRLVDRRVRKLEKGEIDIEDCTIKGSVEFLKTLRRAGVTLYLASGSDDADVREDAARLGYADLFNGGIFGSLGEVGKDAKTLVIERILREVQGGCDHLVAFGDGPVEMRETVKRGGYAVGIASDEIRRFGLNLNKRQRLIRGGACLVIPDFSQRARLCEYLSIPAGS